MVKRDVPLILKGSGEKPTNVHNSMSLFHHFNMANLEAVGAGEIVYDLHADNNKAPTYFCPQCQEEIRRSEPDIHSRTSRVGMMIKGVKE